MWRQDDRKVTAYDEGWGCPEGDTRSKREAVEDKDDAITAHVKKQLAKESSLKNADIDVKTNTRLVSLTGEVPDISTSAHVSWAAWKVHGVQSVKNELTLKEKK